MRWDPAFLYERSVARDREYDGRFLTAVTTTGIYCLASCPARKPKFENVRFFETEAEARAAGFRPCLRCKPDQFLRGEDQDRALYDGLVGRVAADPGAFGDVDALESACGISGTKLVDLVREHAHLSPAALLRRLRVRTACERLIGSNERVLEIGYAVGFESESAFHRQFIAQTGLTPGAFRALRESTVFLLQLPPDYRPSDTLAYHGRDPSSPSERVEGTKLLKAVVLGGEVALLSVSFDRPGAAWCELHIPRHPGPEAMVSVHKMAVRMLGLHCDPSTFESRLARQEPALARLISGREGLRIPLTATPFEALSWAIVGQQINLSFAAALRRELIEQGGRPHAASGMRAHPEPRDVAELTDAALVAKRFSRSKAAYLLGAARAIADGALPLDKLESSSAQLAEKSLRSVRGLGPWTARYTMLRGLGLADSAPIGDSGLSAGLQRLHKLEERPTAKQAEELMAPFAPHRSLATCHLWASLKEAP